MKTAKIIFTIALCLSLSICTIFGPSGFEFDSRRDDSRKDDYHNSDSPLPSLNCKNYCKKGETCTLPTGSQQTPTCTAVCGDGIIVKGK
jgi:hypothetical protein